MPRPRVDPEVKIARRKARALRWYHKNRETEKAKGLARYHARIAAMTPDELAAFREAQNEKNTRLRAEPTPEQLASKRASSRRAHHKHRETLLPKMSARNKARLARMTPEELEAFRLEKNAAMRRFYANNKAVIKERKTIRGVKSVDRKRVIDAANGVCAYCRVYNPACKLCPKGQHKLTVDHITAIVNGGTSVLHNLVACCRSCNAKKRTKPNPIMVQPLLL